MPTGDHRHRGSIWLAGAVLLTWASLSHADEAAETEAKALAGTWKVVSLKSDGQEAPGDVVEKWRWVIRGKAITFVDPVHGETKGSFEVDPKASPKAIDIKGMDGPRKDKSFPCIYKREGKRLTICLPEGKQAEEGRTRPDGFDGGTGMSLLVLEKVEAE